MTTSNAATSPGTTAEWEWVITRILDAPLAI